jgi:hypothetical protein
MKPTGQFLIFWFFYIFVAIGWEIGFAKLTGLYSYLKEARPRSIR